MTVKGLKGVTLLASVNLSSTGDSLGANGSTSSYRFCDEVGAPSMADWKNELELVLTLCPGEKILSNETVSLSFSVVNGAEEQESPPIFLGGSLGQVVTMREVLVPKMNLPLLGVPNGADPLKIVVPKFSTRGIQQSNPVASDVNLITIHFAPTMPFQGANNARMSITGLVSQDTSQSLFGGTTVSLLPVAGYPGKHLLFCKDGNGEAAQGTWEALSATLTLYLCADAQVNFNPTPQTPNPKPQTPNPKPQTPNPKPHIPNPKPKTNKP